MNIDVEKAHNLELVIEDAMRGDRDASRSQNNAPSLPSQTGKSEAVEVILLERPRILERAQLQK